MSPYSYDLDELCPERLLERLGRESDCFIAYKDSHYYVWWLNGEATEALCQVMNNDRYALMMKLEWGWTFRDWHETPRSWSPAHTISGEWAALLEEKLVERRASFARLIVE